MTGCENPGFLIARLLWWLVANINLKKSHLDVRDDSDWVIEAVLKWKIKI